MTDEGYICKCCGCRSWEGDSGDYECPYFDEYGEHEWGMVWTTERE